MARTFYFQLRPAGLGTPEVECLASYLHRLAALHGVTLHQLLAHLTTWWETRPNTRPNKLPKHCTSGHFNGYSPDVAVLVSALEAATGSDILRACTLLSLKKVCAANGTGALKLSRAWCSACYADAEAEGSPIYDRLIWQLQGVDHCLTHHTPLMQQCCNCGDVQRNRTSKTLLSHCENCDAPLHVRIPLANKPRSERFDTHHLASLIEFTASNPAHEFQLGPMTTFCDLMVERYTRRKLLEDLGEVFHKRWYLLKPKLTSMMDISTYFDVPLLSILTSPIDAAAQIDFGFSPIIHDKGTSRNYKDSDRRERAYGCLKRALSAKPPYLSLSAVAALADVSSGYLKFNFPGMITRLMELRKRSNSRGMHLKTSLVKTLLKREGRSPRFATEREYIRWVAGRARTSIHHVRQVVEGRKASKRHRKVTVGPR